MPLMALSIGALALASCSSSATRTSPPVRHSSHPSPSQTAGLPGRLASIVFTSDQSIVLPGSGSTYRFEAKVKTASGRLLREPLRWKSDNPNNVVVTKTGEVTTEQSLGSASILVSASGAQSQAAQVTIAQPGPHTVLVPSSDVKADGNGIVTLTLNADTSAITAGDIVVSGNKAGLLVKVLSVTRGSSSLTVTTQQSSLLDAFPQLSIHAVSAPTKISLNYGALTAAFSPNRASAGDDPVKLSGYGSRYDPAAILASNSGNSGSTSQPTCTVLSKAGNCYSAGQTCSPSSQAGETIQGKNGLLTCVDKKGWRWEPAAAPPKSCTLSPTGSVTASVQRPTLSDTATVNLVAILTHNSEGTKFMLAVQASIPVTVTTGSVTINASGTLDETCQWSVGTWLIQTPLCMVSLCLFGVVSPSVGFSLTGTVSGSATFTGPTVSDTVTAFDGIEYSDNNWRALDTNIQSGVQVTPGSSNLSLSLSADLSPSAALNFGISLKPCLDDNTNLCAWTLGQADLAYVKAAGDADLSISSPFSYLDSGYTGPTWSAEFDITAGPEITSESGVIPTLLTAAGVTLPDQTWSPIKVKIPLAGSPTVTYNSPRSSPGRSVTLSASVPSGGSGDMVYFVLYPTTGDPTLLGKPVPVMQPQPNQPGTASATWTVPASGMNGTIEALLDVSPPLGFGPDLPYAGTRASVNAPGGTSSGKAPAPGTGPTTSSSGWGAPVPIDPGGGGLTSISCTNPTFCVAVDAKGNALTYNGKTWSSAQTVDPHGGGLTSISCTSQTFCMAVDADHEALTYNGQAWSQPETADFGSALASVSCTGPDFCVAVDSNGDAYTYNGTTWSVQYSIGNSQTDLANFDTMTVACVTDSFCMVVDGNNEAFTGGTTPSPPSIIDPAADGLTSVSCPSQSFCLAFDDDGYYLTYNNGQWSEPMSVDPQVVGIGPVFGNGNHNFFSVPDSATCVSPSFCMAVDEEGDALIYNGQTWSGPAKVDPSNFTDVSCPTTSFCVGVDLDGNALTYSK